MSVFIKEITPKNILSFGTNTKPIQLGSLNILIGPNGSGKSNFVDILWILRFLSRNEKNKIPGFIQEIKNKYNVDEKITLSGKMKHDAGDSYISYEVRFFDTNNDYIIDNEHLELYGRIGRKISSKGSLDFSKSDHSILSDSRMMFRSIEGSLFNDAVDAMCVKYENMAFYRRWEFGSQSILKIPQKSDLRNDVLDDDLSNFYIYLARLRSMPPVRRRIIEILGRFYRYITDFNITPFSGYLHLDFEEGDVKIPANRISDGSLRFLVLVALLCDPNPPPLICIEEPELGMHPDSIAILSDLLVEAAGRTQIIITTHSVQLVDSFSDKPEVIRVCDKIDQSTQIKRLNSEEIKVWLKDYSLGQLWTSGQIGGVRS
ncbi:MAG: AAA family ATPase [Armatimonas sp.]